MLKDSSILISGGTGTWGHAFVRRALADGAKRIVVFSRDEYKQVVMAQQFSDERLRFFVGDVRDRDRLRIAFANVDYVFHAAALKQIPVGEYNPAEFVKTNVLGTENVLTAAAEMNVRKVVVLSTDKAAAPTTLYGTTKALAEHLVRTGQHYNPQGTQFSVVRYGNICGSRGSVVPVWRKMLRSGVTELPITHPDMTRFFFLIDDAVDLVLWALRNMSGGELYVPKMSSFYVRDLATAMGAKSTRIIGIRGIEKLAEAMVSDEESRYFRLWEGRYCRFPEGQEKGEVLPDGFSYRSDNNDSWLSVDDLRQLLEATPEALAA